MKAVVQRCRAARVEVDGETTGAIEFGLTVFVGVTGDDDESHVLKMAQKIAALRIFDDAQGRFNHDVREVNGAVLLVSNFTLCGDARKGNRPNFMAAALPERAQELYEKLGAELERFGVRVARGRFGAAMHVHVENDGPVTIQLDF